VGIVVAGLVGFFALVPHVWQWALFGGLIVAGSALYGLGERRERRHRRAFARDYYDGMRAFLQYRGSNDEKSHEDLITWITDMNAKYGPMPPPELNVSIGTDCPGVWLRDNARSRLGWLHDRLD
jgi:hypothetical protein